VNEHERIELAKQAGWRVDTLEDVGMGGDGPERITWYVLIAFDGEPYGGAGDDYGLDWGDNSEAAAWARLPKPD
jgi:hypothetical protein